MGAAPGGHHPTMSIGTSILCIAAGAILKYAVTTDLQGVDLQTVGVILMVVGILGLVISLLLLTRAESAVVARDRVIEREPPPPRY
jgi:hypothetical protein